MPDSFHVLADKPPHIHPASVDRRRQPSLSTIICKSRLQTVEPRLNLGDEAWNAEQDESMKLIPLLLVAALSFNLAACGAPQSGSGSAPASAPSSKGDTPTGPATAPASKPIDAPAKATAPPRVHLFRQGGEGGFFDDWFGVEVRSEGNQVDVAIQGNGKWAIFDGILSLSCEPQGGQVWLTATDHQVSVLTEDGNLDGDEIVPNEVVAEARRRFCI